MFINASVYLYAHLIYKSERLDWAKYNFKKSIKHYQKFCTFSGDQIRQLNSWDSDTLNILLRNYMKIVAFSVQKLPTF